MKSLLAILVTVLLVTSVQAVEVPATELFWDTPTVKADGSVLDDLAGFSLSCSKVNTAPNTWTYKQSITDTTATSILLTVLFTNTDITSVYCVHQSYNATGDYSAYSNVIAFQRTGPGTYTYDDGTVAINPPAPVGLGVR